MKIDFRGLKTKSLDISKSVVYCVSVTYRQFVCTILSQNKTRHLKLEITQKPFCVCLK